MEVDETVGFMQNSLARFSQLELTDSQVFKLSAFTGGHPHLMQLTLSHLHDLVCTKMSDRSHGSRTIEETISEAKRRALGRYRADVLQDVLRGVNTATTAYIRRAYDLRQESGEILVSNLEGCLGKTPEELSATRTRALSTQVLRPAGQGKLRFAIPHYRYLYDELPPVTDEGS